MSRQDKTDSTTHRRVSKGALVYSLILLGWGIYLLSVYNAPNEMVMAEFDITERAAVLLRFTIAVPYLLIWLAIGFAYLKLKTYSEIIRESKESIAFRYFSYGTAILLGGLIFTDILSSVSSLVDADKLVMGFDLPSLLDIAIHYGHTLPYTVAFGLFYYAANHLRTKESIGFNIARFVALALPLVALAYLWLEVIFNISSVGPATSYGMRESLVILTIVIPSLMAWFLGMGAASNLRTYQLKIGGVIYRKALQSFVLGVALLVMGSVLSQSLNSLGTDQLIGLGLDRLLVIIYIFLLIQTSGFAYMALGAKHLTKIEIV